jgi:hypothetical protein
LNAPIIIVIITGQAQERLTAEGAAYSAELTSATKAGRYKEKQQIPYTIRSSAMHRVPWTVYPLRGYPGMNIGAMGCSGRPNSFTRSVTEHTSP